MDLNQLPIGHEFYTVLPYSIKFAYGYAQYLGVIRGHEKLLMYKLKKIGNDEYIALDGYHEGKKVDTLYINENLVWGDSKEVLIEEWHTNFKYNMQALRDFVNNVPDEETGFTNGIQAHEKWLESSTLIK